MDGVLEPLGDPVASECDEGDQTDDFGRAATASSSAASRIVAGFIFDVDRNERDREPGAECCREQAADERNEVDVSDLLRDVDRSLQHKNTEGNARDPTVEAEGCEDGEDQEDNSTRVILTRKHVDGRSECENDVQYSSDPNELFRES